MSEPPVLFHAFGVPVQLKYVALATLVVQTTSAVILTRYIANTVANAATAVNPDGSKAIVEKYHSTTLVVMAEMTKLIISLCLIYVSDAKTRLARAFGGDSPNATPTEAGRLPHVATAHGAPRTQWQAFLAVMHEQNLVNVPDTMKLIVPAALYTLQNNLVYVALANLEATTFQVGYQMKVITTAVLSVIMLGRSLSTTRWTALFLLTGGIIMTQLDGASGDANSKDQSFTIGLISVVICGFSSAFAGVYFEKILKGSAPSVWMRNSQLAFFSTLCGIGGMLVKDGLLISNFFQGYNSTTWLLIAVQAAGGLIVAVVVKYADNILKGFAAAFSIVLCGICSMMIFKFVPSAMFLCGSVVVMGATMLYARPDAPTGENSTNSVTPPPVTPTVRI